ncbi:hypothetical protein [Leptobacterium sp. I13]|uniref:hypothetical protein n=1 Tax=Leptobacterium meishanense TaxID=3128904 RepID=UPI0030EB6730
MNEKDTSEEENKEFKAFEMAASFHTSFSRRGFKRVITEEAEAKAIKERGTTMTADNAFANMITFKQVYRFPYRVKEVKGKNALIMPDFKGVEVEANMFQMNSDPHFFDVEVVFEQ